MAVAYICVQQQPIRQTYVQPLTREHLCGDFSCVLSSFIAFVWWIWARCSLCNCLRALRSDFIQNLNTDFQAELGHLSLCCVSKTATALNRYKNRDRDTHRKRERGKEREGGRKRERERKRVKEWKKKQTQIVHFKAGKFPEWHFSRKSRWSHRKISDDNEMRWWLFFITSFEIDWEFVVCLWHDWQFCFWKYLQL